MVSNSACCAANQSCSLGTHPTTMCITTPTFLASTHSQVEGGCSPAAELNLPFKHAIARRKQVNLMNCVLDAAFSSFSVTPHCDTFVLRRGHG